MGRSEVSFVFVRWAVRTWRCGYRASGLGFLGGWQFRIGVYSSTLGLYHALLVGATMWLSWRAISLLLPAMPPAIHLPWVARIGTHYAGLDLEPILLRVKQAGWHGSLIPIQPKPTDPIIQPRTKSSQHLLWKS